MYPAPFAENELGALTAIVHEIECLDDGLLHK